MHISVYTFELPFKKILDSIYLNEASVPQTTQRKNAHQKNLANLCRYCGSQRHILKQAG